MKSLTIEEQIYFCKYHDVDTSLHTTIGIKEQDVKINEQYVELDSLRESIYMYQVYGK